MRGLRLILVSASLFVLQCLLAATAAFAQSDCNLVEAGHSHNDYLRKRPLYDALNLGFLSVEADIFFAKGNFSVAHTAFGRRKKQNLRKMYLEPLKARVDSCEGRVFCDCLQVFELMLDLKGKWDADRLKELNASLAQFEGLFERVENNRVLPGPLRIVLSGAARMQWADTSDVRRYFFDGGMGSVASKIESTLLARNSTKYSSFFTWDGKDEMPPDERKALEDLLYTATLNNRKIRFWKMPENERIWREFLDAGVRWMNVDNLERFARFFEKWTNSKQGEAKKKNAE